MIEVNSMYDYIVIGAGSAGSIVASKLADSDSNVSILLIEAGGTPPNPIQMFNPSCWFEVLQQYPEIDWGYESQPQPNLNNRVIKLSQAKVIGGSALHNATVYVRGGQSDFNDWGNLAQGWSWSDVEPYFESVESTMKVLVGQTDNFINDLFAAAKEYGLPENPNYNTSESQYGYAPFQFNNNITTDYQLYRETTYTTFWPERYPNVTLLTRALVTKILFRGTQAVGVEYIQGKNKYSVSVAKEIILSGGAIATPKILMLSGIGDEDELAKFDIKTLFNVKEVGKNLYDDLFVSVGFSIPDQKSVPIYPYSLAPAVIFGSTKGNDSIVDIECSVGVGTLKGFPGPRNSFWLWPNVMHLQSKGTVTLRSNSPDDNPLINPGYLNQTEDIESCKAALQLGIEIGNKSSLSQWRKEQIAPQPGTNLEDYIRDTANTTYHYCGTCRMGSDSNSVVDAELKVRGTSGLRVIDASVFPKPITANTAAATMMIAYKGADIIRSC
ncbi:MAG: GMC family oxidoreductase N-terminal domain-containing protein [Trichodesmium sp. MO_231.B1]|nr:GMC family oxidoreductase N-terminal domain-containing protein [Trichodesmium sp. MO_231.B1]